MFPVFPLRGRSAVALSVCLFVWSGRALPADEPDVLVTAARVKEELRETLWSSTVLTREDIEARQPLSTQDLLKGLAGVGVHNAGGLGKATTLFMRGAESDHTLLLIDGVRVGSATLGLPPFELIPVEQIERVEIVRGPRSTLYGSEAMGGVIQIFTRGRSARGFDASGSVGAGSHDTRRASAQVGGSGERMWVRLGGDALESDGIDACAGLPFPPGGGCFTSEPDRDGFRSHAGSLNAGYRFGERLTAELRSLVSEGRTEYDGTFTNVTEFLASATSLHVDLALDPAWHAKVMIGRNEDEQDNFLDETPAGRFDSRRDVASVQLDGRIGTHLRAIAGADHQDDEISSDTAYDRTSRTTTGVFGELHADFAAWTALAGARVEDNAQFGSHTTGSIGAGWSVGDGYRLTATWGTAFRAPTFNELYFPGFGNPVLRPEESRSVEIGLERAAGPAHGSLHVYQTDIDELISFDASTFTSRNIARARVRGAELQGGWRSAAWRVDGQLTLLEAVDRGSGPTRGNILPRRAEQSASLELRRTLGPAAFGALGRWEGRRFDDLANSRRLGGYFTLDLFAEQAIGAAWKLQARLANVLDRDYSTATLFNNDGRNYGITLRYQLAGE